MGGRGRCTEERHNDRHRQKRESGGVGGGETDRQTETETDRDRERQREREICDSGRETEVKRGTTAWLCTY